MIKRRLLIIGLGLAVGCGAIESRTQFDAPPQTPDAGSRSLESLVDPNVQGAEREKLLDILADLPSYQRGNVVYISAQGEVLATRDGIADTVLGLEQSKDNLFASSDGKIKIAMPKPAKWSDVRINNSIQAQALPSNLCAQDSGATGAWSRTVAKPSNYPWMAANVFLPSAVNGKSLRFPTQAPEKLRAFHHSTFIVLASLGKWYSFADFCTSKNKNDIFYATPNAEGAYIYTGGWVDTTVGGAADIDAGFQHSVGNDNWSPFIRVGTSAYIVGYQGVVSDPNQISAPRRFKSDTWASLDFKVETNRVILQTVGWLANPAPLAFWEHWWQNGLTVVVDLSPQALWSTSYFNTALKRMTSIAQNQGFTLNGSYIRNSQWDNIRIRKSNTNDLVPWTQTESLSWRCGFPTNSVSIASVSNVAPIKETVSVTLR
jgi:hypothetical protein